MDVADEVEVVEVIARVTREFGRIDLLCNAAGVPDDQRHTHEVSVESWGRALAVDLDGSLMVCRAVLPQMVARKGGAIVNIASLAAVVASAGGSAYTAVKHGLLGLTKRMAAEYGLTAFA